MKRVLITGITGFIGSNLVRHFSDQSDIVIFGHSRDSKKAATQLKDNRVEMIAAFNAQILDEKNIDTVIHLAGIAHDLSNKYEPADYDHFNFENTKKVFDEFVKSKAKQFIFFSSIKAAVDTSSVPATETIAPTPTTAYGKSKQRAEKYIQSVQLDPLKRAHILRPCMVHGRGNKGNLNLLYRYAKLGVPFPFGSFENKRSFLSIDNLIFFIQVLFAKDIPSGIYHLSDGGYVSTTELYTIISKELGKTPRIWNVPTGLIRFLFALIGKKTMLNKLTESMLVSNNKIMQYPNAPLPLDIREGLKKTVRSFDKKINQ